MYGAWQTCTAAVVFAAISVAADIDLKAKSRQVKADDFILLRFSPQRKFFVVESAHSSSYHMCPDILIV